MLMAFTAPKHRRAMEGPGIVPRPGPHAFGRAFCELIERFPATKLPKAGGVSATVVVTMTIDTLMGRLEEAGVLDTGDRISPGEARRLACEAGIIPAVLGGRSEVLDLGRTRRSHNQPQRIAMGIRDGGCTEPGCDAPPALCHAHHDQAFSEGGITDVEHARLLCTPHHIKYHRRN